MSIVFPTRKTEHWKYTDVSGLLAASFSTGEREKAVEAAKKLSERVRINDAVRLFVVDGFFIEEYSDLKSVPEGVSVQPNAHSLASFDALERHPFVQLNKEKCNGGLCVHIKKGVSVKRPLHIITQTTDRCEQHVYHRLVLEDQAHATAFNEVVQGGVVGPSFSNVVMQVELGQAACMDYTTFFVGNEQAFYVGFLDVLQARDSVFRNTTAHCGAALLRDDLRVHLNGAGAVCHLNGLYCIDGKQHVDYHTEVLHDAPHTTCHQVYRGLLAGDARAVFNGRIVVEKDAQKSEAHLSNKNVLLSKTAEVNTKPELEIYADDVQCSHGATVGQLDEASLFYLQSRGIGYTEAVHLLISALLDVVVATVAHAGVRDHCAEALRLKLEGVESHAKD